MRMGGRGCPILRALCEGWARHCWYDKLVMPRGLQRYHGAVKANPMVRSVRYPPFAKSAKDGALAGWLWRRKAGPPASIELQALKDE